MSSTVPPPNSPPAGHFPVPGEPAWDLALLYPLQGAWSDWDYLALTSASNRLIEFADGSVEILPMPTTAHQRIVLYLLAQLNAFILPEKLGEALCAPLRVKIRDGKFREPDLVFMLSEHKQRVGDEFWDGADLVMEVVSDDPASRMRDQRRKPLDYAEGKIPEYWIVDPKTQEITVLMLQDGEYQAFGKFTSGESACSKLLAGFCVSVAAVFQAAQG
jgi:Uma2 family endonuclease